jgi:deazaflavin-dependent oxidoreductase (nitroreductase family)
VESPSVSLPEDVRTILRRSFFIRTTMRGRRSGRPRTVETTYVWDGGTRLYLSGYPGRRDWVANMAANPDVMLHTVEGSRWYDVPAYARVLRDRNERLQHLLAFIEHWASRMGRERYCMKFALWSIRANRALHLPWWGPFYAARRILDRMPCVEVTIVGPPRQRPGGPPPLSEHIAGRS